MEQPWGRLFLTVVVAEFSSAINLSDLLIFIANGLTERIIPSLDWSINFDYSYHCQLINFEYSYCCQWDYKNPRTTHLFYISRLWQLHVCLSTGKTNSKGQYSSQSTKNSTLVVRFLYTKSYILYILSVAIYGGCLIIPE